MQTKGVEQLVVFRRAYDVSLEIHRATLTFPKLEQFGLAEQMRKASKSIAANLAEGFAKRSSQSEFKRFIKIAIGSSDEMQVWTKYCSDLGYIRENEYFRWKAEYVEISKMLAGLIKAIHLQSDV